ncbi:MAG TPA: IS1182 family transposase [Nitrolancea sp.]|nr:IS1182 family transposase [Nitrolancea sp.]
MLGPPKGRCLDRPVLVSLEGLVPAGHFYRHLEAALDLDVVREWVAGCYAERGRPSIDPVTFFKLQLIMFFEGLRSERRLLETASLNLAHRWYLGYHLDEPLPDHSSLTRIRERYGLDVFRHFFDHVVQRCVDAGLVWGEEVFFDATKVRANAALDSLAPRLREVVDGHLATLFPAAPAAAAQAAAMEGNPAPAPVAAAPGTAGAPLPAFPSASPSPANATPGEQPAPAAARWALLEACRLDPDRPAARGYERTSDWRVSTTDPDAALMKAAGQRPALGYHDHYVVDGGKARIILHALITPADVMENEPMLDQFRRIQFRWHLRPKRVVADTTYGTAENIGALEQAGIRAYVPLPDCEGRTPYFGSGRFTYAPADDAYCCPAGQPLRRRKAKYTEGVVVYRAEAATCNACALKGTCTPSDHGRTIHRSFHADALERVRGYHATAAYQRAMRKRKVWPEPLFAEAKQWHGLRQFRLRGLQNVNMEGLLVAAGQNLKRWLSATGWGRRHGPTGSLRVARLTIASVPEPR